MGTSKVSELLAPLRLRSGATTVTAPSGLIASLSACKPSARYPSSLESRIFTKDQLEAGWWRPEPCGLYCNAPHPDSRPGETQVAALWQNHALAAAAQRRPTHRRPAHRTRKARAKKTRKRACFAPQCAT